MPKSRLELNDVAIDIDVPDQQAHLVQGYFSKKVDENFDVVCKKIGALVKPAVEEVRAALAGIEAETTIEMSFGFTIEGKLLLVAGGKLESGIKVSLTLKSK